MKITTCGCYSCENEVPIYEGQMVDLPYDELIGQVFICDECLRAEELINQERDDYENNEDGR